MEQIDVDIVTKLNCMSIFLSQLIRYLEEGIEPMPIQIKGENGFLDVQLTIINKIKELKSKANG